MKRLQLLLAASAFMFVVSATAAEAEMGVIYGPVYVSKSHEKHHDKESKFTFAAPVAGNGVVVVKNGGDSGKKARVSSAEIELNGHKIAGHKDFKKSVEELSIDVQLNDSNKLEVEVESCKSCELSITVLGELPVREAPPVPPVPPVPPAPPAPPVPPVI